MTDRTRVRCARCGIVGTAILSGSASVLCAVCGRDGAVHVESPDIPVQSYSDCLRECRDALGDAELRADFYAREFNLANSGRFEAMQRADACEAKTRELAQKLEDMTARAVLAESMLDRNKTP